eukprot:194304_1
MKRKHGFFKDKGHQDDSTKRFKSDPNELKSEDKPIQLPSKQSNNSNSNDVLSTEQAVDRLSKLFEDVEQPNTLTSGGSASLPLIPGLYVDGIGDIPLPICSHQLSALITLCSPKNSNDTNSNIHKLDASQFRFTNPRWNSRIQSLIHDAARNLGCTSVGNVIGRCHKLWIHTHDVDCIRHENKQQSDDMFASLNVTLPSKYEIVNRQPMIVIKHKTKTVQHHLGHADAFDIYYDCSYCNLPHQINQIKHGTRLVLEYHLLWNGTPETMPKINSINMTRGIVDVLKCWGKNDIMTMHLKYEGGCGGLQDVSGSNYIILYDWQQACNETGYCLFTAHLRQNREYCYNMADDLSDVGSDDCRDPPDDVDFDKLDWGSCWDPQEYCEDHCWSDMNGNEFKFAKYLDHKPLLQHCIHGDADKWEFNDEECEMEYWDAKKTEYYDKYIAICFKKENGFNLFLRDKEKHGIGGGVEWIKYLLAQDPFYDVSIEVDTILQHFNANNAADKSIIPSILLILLKSSRFDLILTVINVHLIGNKIGLNHNTDPSSSYSSWNDAHIKIIFDIIVRHGWTDPLKTSILKLLDCVLHCQLMHELKQIRNYCAFAKLIREAVRDFKQHQPQTEQKEDTNDVVPLPSAINKQLVTVDLSECLKDISHQLWNNIIVKLDLNGDGKRMAALDFINVIQIIRFIMFLEEDNDTKYTLLRNGYKNVSLPVQKQVIAQFSRTHYFHQRRLYHDASEKPKEIAKLIVEYGWNDPIKLCVSKYISDVSVPGISKICSVIDLLKDKINEKDRELIANIIIEAIQNKVQFKKLNKYSSDEVIPKLMIFLVSWNWNKDKQQGMYTWFATQYAKNITPGNQERIVNVIKQWDNTMINDALTQSIMKCRTEYLQSIKDKGEPQFTWRMADAMDANKNFKSFLQSAQKVYTFHDVNGIGNARSWARSHQGSQYNKYKTGYSAKCTAGGIGKKAFVKVEKTKDYFKYRLEHYQKTVKELNSLLLLLNTK